MKLQLVNSVDDYELMISSNTDIIPIIKNRNIDENKLINFEKSRTENKEKIKIDYVVYISKDIQYISSLISRIYDYKEILYLDNLEGRKLDGIAVIVGLYDDFTTTNIQKIEYIFSNDINLSFLIGEDIASLTFQIAKQKFHTEAKDNLIVFGNILSPNEMRFAELLEENGIDVITYKSFNDEDLPEKLCKAYKNALIFSHGKDDHINIGEYTLCGKHHTDGKSCKGPLCFSSGTCFKSENKLIKISDLKAENIILASCHSGVLSDANNYDKEFNLMLSSLYSDARTITFAVSGSRFDYKEICKLLSEKNEMSPAAVINKSLADIHIKPVYFSIGSSYELMFNHIKESVSEDIDQDIDSILDTLKVFIEYSFLPENEDFTNKVYALYRWMIKNFSRATIWLPVVKERLKDLKSQLNSLDEELAGYFSKNYYAIGDMSSFALNNLKVNHKSHTGRCLCGNKSYTYNLSSNEMSFENVKETFCYKCSDEKFMLGNITVQNEEYKYDSKRKMISYSGQVYLEKGMKLFFGIGFPGYMKNYLASDTEVKNIEAKEAGFFPIQIEVALKDNVPCQAHYCGIYFVRNMSIYHHKFTFLI